MGKYDIELKRRVVMNALHELGLEIKNGNKHDTAKCPKTGRKTTIPRHKKIEKPTVKSIIIFLISCGYAADDVERSFEL